LPLNIYEIFRIVFQLVVARSFLVIFNPVEPPANVAITTTIMSKSESEDDGKQYGGKPPAERKPGKYIFRLFLTLCSSRRRQSSRRSCFQ
jgi:hypothetical protein